jgi:hypothetical protein
VHRNNARAEHLTRFKVIDAGVNRAPSSTWIHDGHRCFLLVKCLLVLERRAIVSRGTAPGDLRPLVRSSLLDVETTLSIERMRNRQLTL